MSDPALAIYFDGPFQSWGVSSRFQHRNSEAFPTKSAVIGIIAAALGIDKNGDREAQEIDQLRSLNVSAFRLDLKSNKRSVQRLLDFHTVGGGYDSTSTMQKLSIPRKASGGASANAVITRRTYLNDARFAVVLEGKGELLDRCRAALLDPVWGVWLGRKSCIPAAPLSPLVGSDRADALHRLLNFLNLHRTQDQVLVFGPGVEEVQESGESSGVWYPQDQPLSLSSREFTSRPVRRSSS